MPIVIKEIFSSDPISEALEKINFNFDQLILSGGGPPGPIGPIGLPGIAGPQGLRGDHWQVGGASGLLGFTGPTSDHGPNFGDLQDSDTWMDSKGNVWVWQGGATDSWVYSGVNLKGPTGLIGPSGGSTDLNMYLGSSGSANDVGSYIPSISVGPTSISQGHADFYILNKSNVNAFLIGDPSWAYNKLKNFSNLDYINGVLLAPSERMIPKQTIIQSGIDYTGFGGLSIGAYGLTGATSTVLNDYVGGSSQASITSATGFFNAGWKIRQNSDSTYSHVFNLKTGFNDLEIQSGDALDPLLGNTTTGKISIISKTIELKGSAGEIDPIRFITNPTYSRFRNLLAVGFNTLEDTTLLPGIIAADWYTNRFIVNGNSRIYGELFVGNRTTATSSIFVGVNRLIDGNSEINFYSAVGNSGFFQIKRELGIDGKAQIYNTGAGHLSIVNTGGGNIDLYGPNSAWIGLRNIGTNTSGIDIQTSNTATSYVRFIDQASIETARFDMANQRLGIGTTVPGSPLHVNGILGGTQATIATFSNKLNTSYTTIGAAGVLSDVTSWNSGSNILEFVSWNPTGNGIIGSYTGNLKFQTGYRQDRMIILEGGDVGIGTNTPLDKLQVVGGDISLNYGRSIRARGFDYSKLIETSYDGGIGADVTYIYTAGAVSTNISPKITITSKGNVGIETATPASKLHIKSTSNLYQDANIKLEGHISGNQSIIDFYPFSYNTANVQDPSGRSIIGPTNENLYGRLGVVGYRESQNTTNANNRNLYITSERYKIGIGLVGPYFRGFQSELGNINVESAGYINLKVNQYQLANATAGAAFAMPIVYNVDMLTIVPGTGNYGTSPPYMVAYNTFPRIGINNRAPLAGYRLHIDGDTLLDGNLVFGGNALGGGTATNYSVKTLGAQPLRIGTNNKTNIFIRDTDGFVGIGNPSTTVKSDQITAPLSPLQVTIPFENSTVIDSASPHAMKHNLGRYIGSMGDYQKGLIMLHPAANGENELPFSMCCGKFYIVRGGVGPALIIDTIEVDSASGHLSNRGVVKANISHDGDNGDYIGDETTRRDNVFLTTVQLGDLSGNWWVALYIGYPLQAHSVYFDGINNNSGWSPGDYPVDDMFYFKTYVYPGGVGYPFPGSPPGFYSPGAFQANQTIFTNKYKDYAPTVRGPGIGPYGYNINKFHQGVDVFSGIKFQNVLGQATGAYIKNKIGFHISFQTNSNSSPTVIFNSGYFGGFELSGNSAAKLVGCWISRQLLPGEHVIFNITPGANYGGANKEKWIVDYVDYPVYDAFLGRTYFALMGFDIPNGVNNYNLQVEGTVWSYS